MDAKFEISPLLKECNSFEKELLLEVFQDEYADGLKTRDLISHICLRAESLGVLDDERISSALARLSSFEKYHRGLIRGFDGERRAYRSVKHAMVEKRILLNLEIDVDGEHSEFDQLVITPSGLVVIEVKNYSQDAFIDADGMLRCESNGKSILYNAGEKMRAKTFAISKALEEGLGIGRSECPVFDVLVNANERSFIRNDFGKIKVCGTGSIPYYIESLGKGDLPLSLMDSIASFLTSIHKPVDIEPPVDLPATAECLEAAIALMEEAPAIPGDNRARPEQRTEASEHLIRRPANRVHSSLIAAAAAGALGFIGGITFAKAATCARGRIK